MLLTEDEITLRALRVEHEKLRLAADKAKSEVDEYLNAGNEYIAIHREVSEIVSSGSHGSKVVKALDALKRRSHRADLVMKKDLIHLADRQQEAEWERDLAANAIHGLEWRLSVWKGRQDGSADLKSRTPQT